MNGTVYSGIVHIPQHPDADMHGLLRLTVRCRSRLHLSQIIRNQGIVHFPNSAWQSGIWQDSKSAVEQAVTSDQFGVLFTCRLIDQYVRVDVYHPMQRESRRKQA